MKRFWLRNEKIFICLTYILSVMVFSVWAAQVAVVSTDTREQAWAKETLNNSDLQTNIDGKADALTADENYVTDAQLVVVGNTSNTNSGDQTISDAVYGVGWDTDTTSAASKNALYDKIESIVGGITDINDLGDATADGTVQLVTHTITFDPDTGHFRVGDGTNYVNFSATNISFAGSYYMAANLVSDYVTFTPAATEPATTDGLIRNVSGVSGYPDVLSQFDGTNVWRYIAVDSDDTVGAGYMIGHDGTNWEAVLIQSQLKANPTGTFAAPITANPYTLTAANCYNAVLFYGATGETDMPAGVEGMAVIVKNTGAFTITIDPNGSEVIVREGVTQTGGVSITLSSGAGNQVALFFDGTYWVTFGKIGTLAEGT